MCFAGDEFRYITKTHSWGFHLIHIMLENVILMVSHSFLPLSLYPNFRSIDFAFFLLAMNIFVMLTMWGPESRRKISLFAPISTILNGMEKELMSSEILVPSLHTKSVGNLKEEEVKCGELKRRVPMEKLEFFTFILPFIVF